MKTALLLTLIICSSIAQISQNSPTKPTNPPILGGFSIVQDTSAFGYQSALEKVLA